MEAYLIANGKNNLHFLNSILAGKEHVYIADGALNFANISNIKFNIEAVIGDLDSTNGNLNTRYIKLHNQDQTDLAKAVNYLYEIGFIHIVIIGANSNDYGHSLSNLFVAYNCKAKVSFISNHHTAFFIRDSLISNELINTKISLIPWHLVSIVTQKGLKYPLPSELSWQNNLSISNVIISDLILKFSGTLLVCITKRLSFPHIQRLTQ